MNKKSQYQFNRKTGLLLASTVVFYALLAFYIHFVSFKSPYIGIQLGQSSGSEWVVQAVEERGLADKWDIEPGDRIVSMEGKPEPRLIGSETEALLSKAGSIVVQKKDGRMLEFRSAAGLDDIERIAFSIALELTLLGIGGYALRIKPESRVIRLFYY